MRRFLTKENYIPPSEVVTTTTAGSTTKADRAGTASAPYLDTRGKNRLTLLANIDSATGSPTVKAILKAFSHPLATAVTASTTVGTASATAITTGKMLAVNVWADKLKDTPYVKADIFVKSGKGVVRTFYLMGVPYTSPVTQTAVAASTTAT